MAYTVPDRFAHGDTINATKANKWSTSLLHIYGLLPAWAEDWAVEAFGRYGVTFPGVDVETTDVVMSYTHCLRWLVYKGAGKIYDANGNSTSISDASDGGTNIFDLESVSWLTYGMEYFVTGVECCLEDWYA